MLTSGETRLMPRGFELLLTIAASAVAIAMYLSLSYGPHEPAVRALAPLANVPLLRGPSVLASLKPVPELNLALPDDVAAVVARRGINGETGLIRTAASITTFQLRSTGDLVSVAAPTGLDPVRTAGDPSYRVHGVAAIATTSRGSTVIRWTENGVTYEISSRTLDASQLIEVANNLR